MGTPARCASSLRGSPCCPSRAHQGQHRKQWSGDAVAAVAAQIHAVDTLLRRAWERPMRRGCFLSRAGGPAEALRDVSSRAGEAQMAEPGPGSPSDRRHLLSAESLADHGAGFPFGEAVRDANVYWVRLVEINHGKPGDLPKHSFKLMVGLDEPERLSGLERDAFTRAYFATLKFREGILTIGQDGEPTLQRNTSITLKAAGVLQKTYVITAIQFLGTLPEVPMLGPPLREYSLPTTPIARLVQDPRYNPRPPV